MAPFWKPLGQESTLANLETTFETWFSPVPRWTASFLAWYTPPLYSYMAIMVIYMAINIGNPGDMVTVKAFVKFSSDSSRAFYVSLVEENQKEDFNHILFGLCATVKVINSQKRRVNTEKLRELILEVYLKIVQCFPWAVISPSVHRILAHSWEVIELNKGFGLGDLSEEGLEALNKLIREMRVHGSRKDSTVNNFSDTYNHLWDRSRPTIVEMERVIRRKKQKILISTEIEALVDSLFLEEAQDD